MRIALFEPDIPQNCGTILRLCACLGVPVDIVEPCGFLWHDRRLRRAGMDYLHAVELSRHESWAAFESARRGRLVLLTTKAERSYLDFAFDPHDVILLGRESAGVPAAVHTAAAARLKIPMRHDLRSINVALAASMVLGEALRQTKGFPR
jgi:tRNA (cytidine/uridine-2'-O-)-methyltransferase